ncbi:MAG TPA: peptidoglycan DD-metalloendopeptidase family protein [Acidimicrobiia bacterium]|nr:peptidoglycan DD-metalloendopeptidase family protein [Acidimicrobiia bacterium]
MSRRLLSALVVLGVLVALSAPALAYDLEDDLADIQSRMDSVRSQIDSAASQRSSLAADLSASEGRLDGMIAELNRTRLELSLTRDLLQGQETMLADVRLALAALYSDLAATREDVAASRDDAEHWARQLYMNAGQDEAFLALSAGELADISVGMGYLNAIAVANERSIVVYEALRQSEQRQAERIALRQAELAAEVANLSAIAAGLADLENAQVEQQAAVEAEIARQRTLLTDLASDIAQFEGELASLEAEQDRIESTIRAEQDSGGAAPSQFVRPVPGAITSPFGPRVHPILGYARMHTGLDFRAPHGQAIRAAASGRVILAGPYGGYGNTIVIDHGGGVATLYAHQSSLAVGYGAQIGAGDTVGYIGSTGFSTGPHLHFEVRVNGEPVNPVPYL